MLEIAILLTAVMKPIKKWHFLTTKLKTVKKYGIRVIFYLAAFKRKIRSHGAKTWKDVSNQFLVTFFKFAGVELPKNDPKSDILVSVWDLTSTDVETKQNSRISFFQPKIRVRHIWMETGRDGSSKTCRRIEKSFPPPGGALVRPGGHENRN